MQIGYRTFTDTIANTMRFYVAEATEAKKNKNPLAEQLSMASAAAVFYSWLDIAETLPAEAVKTDTDQLKAIIQAVDPLWPPTEAKVKALQDEIKGMLKR